MPKEELGQSQSLADLHQGLQLTESQLLKVSLVTKFKILLLSADLHSLPIQVFNKHGLVQENPMGEKFDPNKHDALFQVLGNELKIEYIHPCSNRRIPHCHVTVLSVSLKVAK